MPQMSPLSWTFIFMTLLVFISLISVTMKKYEKQNKMKKDLTSKEMNMKW